MDISPYQICSNPKIWVFDDLLSSSLLDHVDRNFAPQVSLGNDEESLDTWRVDDPALTDEFVGLLVRVCGIEPVEKSMRQLTIGDVRKKDQSCHMDRVEVGGRSPHVQTDAVGFLDMSKQDFLVNSGAGSRVIIPTLSFVVYFEDNPGGITFPDAAGFDSSRIGISGKENGSLSVDGRRGRIIMFQNYLGGHRSADPRARHFGTFDPRVPKRNFIGGVVANENPLDSASRGSRGVPGLLYGVLDSITPASVVQDESLRARDYPFGMGHHHHDENLLAEEEAREEEERQRQRLLATSISQETASEYPTHHKDALIHLLTTFSQIDSKRESANLRPINSEIWWNILSMMNGSDLNGIIESVEARNGDHDEASNEEPNGSDLNGSIESAEARNGGGDEADNEGPNGSDPNGTVEIEARNGGGDEAGNEGQSGSDLNGIVESIEARNGGGDEASNEEPQQRR